MLQRDFDFRFLRSLQHFDKPVLTPVPFYETRSSVSPRQGTQQSLCDLRVSERLAYVRLDSMKHVAPSLRDGELSKF